MLNPNSVIEHDREFFLSVYKEFFEQKDTVIAGGRVLSYYTNNPKSHQDIDLFFFSQQAHDHLLQNFVLGLSKTDYLVKKLETKFATTLFVSKNGITRKVVQFIKKIYEGPKELLDSFDMENVKCFVYLTKLYYCFDIYRSSEFDACVRTKEIRLCKVTENSSTRIRKLTEFGYTLSSESIDMLSSFTGEFVEQENTNSDNEYSVLFGEEEDDSEIIII